MQNSLHNNGGRAETRFQTIVIVGIGLLGGSLGMAAKRRGLTGRVIGIDIDPESVAVALELEAIDVGYSDFSEIDEPYEMVILAAPISINSKILADIAPVLLPEALITDVGSTKGSFVREAEAIFRSKDQAQPFVGGHPMAGSEIAGVKGADPYLFENAVYVLTPTQQTKASWLATMEGFVEGLGARVRVLEPDEHDAMVAAVSHVPHLAASALVNAVATVQEKHPHVLGLAAGGFRDTTRIAAGNPQLWRDICFQNRAAIVSVVDQFQHCLQDLREDLEQNRDDAFYQRLLTAKEVRQTVPAKLKGYWPLLEEVIVTIPDQPGMIGEVAAVLGQKGVNIDDIEILRLREGEGGTLRLGFNQAGAAEQAVAVLRQHGFLCRIKP